MYLAGDVGGTKTALALYEPTSDGIKQVREQVFPSQDHGSLEAILTEFLKDHPAGALKSACFGVAGPVIEGRCQTTNLPWVLEEKTLASALGVKRAKLLNDLEAAAYGMLHVKPDELVALNPKAPARRKGNVALIAAGTGLGEAMLYWDGERYHPIASEGGHADFAPRDDLQVGLLQYLRESYGAHVSYERVLSGPGFFNIYEYLRDRGHYPESSQVAEQMKTGDPNAAISQHGLSGDDPLCKATIDLFCSVYGAEAGNIALRCMAIGGVFIGGGIAPKLLPALTSGLFWSQFIEKGRFVELLKGIEVNVVLNPRTPLLGAAYYALQL